MAKCRFLGRACIELITLVDHIIIDPHYSVSPEEGINHVFLTHEHEDHTDIEKIEILKRKATQNDSELEIYGPKIISDGYDLDVEKIKDGKVIELEELKLIPYKVDCYKAEECFAYLIKKGDINLLHTADSGNFSKPLRNLGQQVDYCFVSCFKDYYTDYLDFLQVINPLQVFPYHFDPGEEEKAKDFSEYLQDHGIEAKFIEIGTEFEF